VDADGVADGVVAAGGAEDTGKTYALLASSLLQWSTVSRVPDPFFCAVSAASSLRYSRRGTCATRHGVSTARILRACARPWKVHVPSLSRRTRYLLINRTPTCNSGPLKKAKKYIAGSRFVVTIPVQLLMFTIAEDDDPELVH
jgi:hypothetical protein